MNKVVIRGYRGRDKEECRALWGELTQWHRDIYDDPGIGGANPGLYFDKHLKKVGPSRLIVASVGSKVVGLTGYMEVDEELEVEPLIVSSDYRGKGIGAMLLKEVIKQVRKRMSAEWTRLEFCSRRQSYSGFRLTR